jgi:hypothetical protein
MKEYSEFTESLKRLYKDKKVADDKIISLFNNGKLTEKEKNYILNQ